LRAWADPQRSRAHVDAGPKRSCFILVRAISGDDWTALIARARPLAASPRR
jgi:hypothetical protein